MLNKDKISSNNNIINENLELYELYLSKSYYNELIDQLDKD